MTNMSQHSLLFFEAAYNLLPQGKLTLELPHCGTRTGLVRHARVRRTLKDAKTTGWVRGVSYFKTTKNQLIEHLELQFLELIDKPNEPAMPYFTCVGEVYKPLKKAIGIKITPTKAPAFTIAIPGLPRHLTNTQVAEVKGYIKQQAICLGTVELIKSHRQTKGVR
jgi:hypothetical protein